MAENRSSPGTPAAASLTLPFSLTRSFPLSSSSLSFLLHPPRVASSHASLDARCATTTTTTTPFRVRLEAYVLGKPIPVLSTMPPRAHLWSQWAPPPSVLFRSSTVIWAYSASAVLRSCIPRYEEVLHNATTESRQGVNGFECVDNAHTTSLPRSPVLVAYLLRCSHDTRSYGVLVPIFAVTRMDQFRGGTAAVGSSRVMLRAVFASVWLSGCGIPVMVTPLKAHWFPPCLLSLASTLPPIRLSTSQEHWLGVVKNSLTRPRSRL